MMQNNTSELENAKMVYKTAKLVRSSITNFSKQKMKTVSVSSTSDDVPADLYSLIRWILFGSEEQLQTEVRSRVVDRSALTICQNIMYAFKTTTHTQDSL